MSGGSRVERIRARLGHPVVDADGHTIEYLPAVRDDLQALAGRRAVEQLDAVLGFAQAARALSFEQRRALGLPRLPWWGLPARNTLNRATALLPRLLYQRLDEIGLDFAVLYPTYGLLGIHLPDDELRRASCRAFNEYHADLYREHAKCLAPVAIIPMNTPEEAIAELDHSVGKLGFKGVMMAGAIRRPLPAAERLAVARELRRLTGLRF